MPYQEISSLHAIVIITGIKPTDINSKKIFKYRLLLNSSIPINEIIIKAVITPPSKVQIQVKIIRNLRLYRKAGGFISIKLILVKIRLYLKFK